MTTAELQELAITIRNTTIEECAKVAENCLNEPEPWTGLRIVAAIRKLSSVE